MNHENAFPAENGFSSTRLTRKALSGRRTQVAPYQKLLYRAGLLLILSGLFHLGVWLVEGGSLAGPVSWRKPIVFGLSGGLVMISLGWVMTYLRLKPGTGWILSVLLAFSLLVEVFLISMQTWRGVPSHFNNATPFDTAVFAVMGTLIVLVEAIVVLLTVWCFRRLQISGAMASAIRAGMLLLVVSQIFGNLIVQNGVRKTLDLQTGQFHAEGVSSAYIFGEAGSMKVPHALTLHAIQVLPVLAFLVSFTGWSEARRSRAVLWGAAGYFGLVAVSTAQTFRGRAEFNLDAFSAAVLLISVLAVAAPFAAAVAGAWSQQLRGVASADSR